MSEQASHQTKSIPAAAPSLHDDAAPEQTGADSTIFRSLASAGSSPPLKPTTIRRLQAVIGNQAVRRVMENRPQLAPRVSQLPRQFLAVDPQALQRQESERGRVPERLPPPPPVRLPDRVEDSDSRTTPLRPDEPVRVSDPVIAPETADMVVRSTLGRYMHQSIAAGRQIAGIVNVVDDITWDRVGVTRYGSDWFTEEHRHTREASGYVQYESDGSSHVWIHRDRQNIQVMLHETIHVYSNSITLYSSPLREGITEYFTRRVMRDLGLPVSDVYYPAETAIVELLAGVVSEGILADAYFENDGDGLRAAFVLGVGETNESIYWTFTSYMQNARWDEARDILTP